MSLDPLEHLLGKLYSDPKELDQFLADRTGYARELGVGAEDVPDLLRLDERELRFAVGSFARKRGDRGHG